MFVTKHMLAGAVALAVLATGFTAGVGHYAAASTASYDEPKKDDKDKSKDEQPQGFLGIMFAGQDEGATPEVTGTVPDSPAEKAGFKEGDVILKIGDKEAKDIPTAIQLARALKPGQKVKVKIKRGDKEMNIDVTVGKRPEES